MTLTSGYEMTTAATNLFNAFITVIMMIGVLKMKGPKIRKQVWLAAFALFLLVSLIGTYVHGVELSEAGRNSTWNILYIVMALMVASLACAVLYEIHGPSCLKKAVPAFACLALAFIIIRPLLSSGFLPFLIYCGGTLLFLLVKILLARKEKPHLILLFWAIVVLIIGSALQNVKTLKFHLFYDFNYNGVYHVFTLVFLIMSYLCIQQADRLDTAEKQN